MSESYWQAKIWGLLHDSVLKALHTNSECSENSFWQELDVMQNWRENSWNPETSGGGVLEHIYQADYIASASDRGAIGSVTDSINYGQGNNGEKGLEIFHLLSGAKHDFKIKQHSEMLAANPRNYLTDKEQKLLKAIPAELRTDIKNIKGLFWWLWRCLPVATCREFDDESLMLMPAETRLPDSSIWSHGSITAALAGALAGYDLTSAEIKHWPVNKTLSRPYLASFTFTPVQELIKASRKMRDFWAGSWLLHYLSAKVCWQLAQKYGPDCFLYPSLYQQPLIDYWLLKEFPEFDKWVEKPEANSLLTAGFPNVLVLVLPKDKVKAAMQRAKQILLEEWARIGDFVFDELKTERYWMPDLTKESKTWKGWLQSQWQFYWTALPIGKEEEPLKNAAIPIEQEVEFLEWLDAQNQAYNLTKKKQKLFQDDEITFLREAYQHQQFSVNVGSWWASIFDANRHSLAAVKNARNWELPTAFGPRSTISGIGPVVHPGNDWITDGETKKYWEQHAGLFDGREQLNATETVKRVLEKVLHKLLDVQNEDAIAVSYPDLTAGVAGYLKVYEKDINHELLFEDACQAIIQKFTWAKDVMREMRNKWGIPWIDKDNLPQRFHPRLLNSGWLVEDADTPELKELQDKLKIANEQDKEVIRKDISDLKKSYRQDIQKIIDSFYPGNNPADWYVLAAGDGDGMSEWLQGIKLKEYQHYIPSQLSVSLESFQKFLEVKKRMGPSTHNALSRALLDFSNQLVPYLTEQRYAGRLIYGGGDDVLAYTNLWEWDNWLWDIRQCFRGDEDPQAEFDSNGDYWTAKADLQSKQVAKRPLFTMGKNATISFGIVIVHHSVPLAIALENLWLAEKKAKEHKSADNQAKDAVQVRVLYGNGNNLQATSKFLVFDEWRKLISTNVVDSAIFEQAATLWSQHPAPSREAILPWTKAFCDRRDQFQGNETLKKQFQSNLADFLKSLILTTQEKDLDNEIQNWLKLAAFIKRHRRIMNDE
ncbi:type III-B CRISPR-associated protein Cas10/Cmr2 [Komarekiella sp. 'clone 1']|uniref:Type III-B CRISPR-associated protein Cas10/Cmr2 n=1 Tax=Komarekiella delphini-convector SJRDD-AB1 TaxID=2593771 RepID=A0AA40SWM1_9NOST|nr:type III-B CRISPR-associated protein Cas10/Cmr2 [Komarekiella delphini-convector SJRDD-AB1]